MFNQTHNCFIFIFGTVVLTLVEVYKVIKLFSYKFKVLFSFFFFIILIL